MANLSLIRVNQKLAQAKWLIDYSEQELLAPVQSRGLVEAAAFDLVCAYQQYLYELIEIYGLKYSLAVRTELDLVRVFEVASKFPAEAVELVNLRQDPHSWASQLHSYYDSLWQQPKSSDPVKGQGEIYVVDMDAVLDARMVSMVTIKHWYDNFFNLVHRHRQTSAEF